MNHLSKDDLEALFAPDAIPCVEIELPEKRQFLRGPVDWPDTCTAARLPGRALAVWLLLHLRQRMQKGDAVTLPNRRLAEMGIDRSAKRRALQALEKAGLIRVFRNRGRSPLASVVPSRKRNFVQEDD